MLARFLATVAGMAEELGWHWGILIAGLVGALLSLFSIDPAVATLRLRITTLASGVALSWFGTPALGNYWEITKVPVLSGIALVLGLYGLAIVKEVSDFIKSGGVKTLLSTITRLRGKDQ